MVCSNFFPTSGCGTGTCEILEQNTTEQFCICDEGWSTSTEFNLFVKEVDLDSSNCFYNLTLINTFWGLVGSVAVVLIIVQLGVIDGFRKFKRQVPTLMFSFITLVLSIYRISKPDALFGDDVFFTFCVINLAYLGQIQSYIFLTKYLRYMSAKISGLHKVEDSCFIRSYVSTRAYLLSTVISVLSFQSLYVFLFLDRNECLVITRVVLGYQAARTIYQVVYFYISLGELTKDMDHLVSLAALDEVVRSENVKDGTIAYLKQKSPKIRTMRKWLIINGILECLFWLLSILFDVLIILWSYILPLMILLTLVPSLAVVKNKADNFRCRNILTSSKNFVEDSTEDIGNPNSASDDIWNNGNSIRNSNNITSSGQVGSVSASVEANEQEL